MVHCDGGQGEQEIVFHINLQVSRSAAEPEIVAPESRPLNFETSFRASS